MASKPLVFKTAAKAWVFDSDADTVTQITDVNYPGAHTYTISALTSVTTTATATTSAAHGLAVGDGVTVAGADQTEYNGTYAVVTVADTTHFTYTFVGSATTPATGTITAEDGRTTVPGIVHLDGTYYVMIPAAEIYGSGVDDPATWTALNFISAETETDTGVAIAKNLNYLVAFGQWTTEFFYNAGQPAPGSPLLRAENMFLQMGCASAKSIAQCDNSIIWVGQTKEGQSGASYGRSVVQVVGTKATTISSPLVDIIITADDLATVYSTAFKHAGHSFYVLTLVSSNITLVYDLNTHTWYQWTSMTVQAPKSVTSLTYSSATGLATATAASHGYADGDLITIAGAGQSAYNVTENITYLTADTFSYPVSSSPATPATGTITATGYTEGYFKLVKHTATGTANLFADTSAGKLYSLTTTEDGDSGVYINQLIRTQIIDGGNNHYKPIEALDLIGDRVSGDALIRYSKDDYQTFSKYRKVDMSLVRSHLSRLGRGRRISFDVRITDSISVRLERMDVTFGGE